MVSSGSKRIHLSERRLKQFGIKYARSTSVGALAPARRDLSRPSPLVPLPAIHTISLNGASREVRPGTTVADLLAELGKNPRFLAVERNTALVPRTRHAECVLEPGDRIEIVTLVGGG